MATYFPDKPADVTCATCPYSQEHNGKLACQRKAPSFTDTDGWVHAEYWCGEHPWFVAERNRLASFNIEPTFVHVIPS